MTKEIREQATSWDGKVPGSWEFVGMAENRWNYIRYYVDKQGRYYFTTMKKKQKREYRIEVREENGITYARKVPCGLGQWGSGL